MLKRVYIEIINRCNLQCSFCPPTMRPACTLSAADFDRLAVQVKPHCDYIYLHIKGEPLLHPQLPELLESAARHRLLVNLTTNGLLLPALASLLHNAPALRQTNLSLHGYTPASHGPLEPWLEQLVAYARQEAAQGRYCVFRFWTLPESRQPDPLSARMLSLLEQAFDQPPGSLVLRAGDRSVALQKGVFASFDRQFAWPSLQAPDYGDRGRCYGAREMIGILADGTVVPCCLDGEGACALGNALTTPLTTILESEPLQAMAQGFRQQRVIQPLCRRCGYRMRFSGKAVGGFKF